MLGRQLYSFAYGYLFVPEPFVENAILFSCSNFVILFENQLTIHVQVYFWILNSKTLISLFLCQYHINLHDNSFSIILHITSYILSCIIKVQYRETLYFLFLKRFHGKLIPCWLHDMMGSQAYRDKSPFLCFSIQTFSLSLNASLLSPISI